MPEKKQIGKVSHYFSKIDVAVLELTDGLNVGDVIEIVTHEGPFQQKVDSMQIEHASVQKAGAGQSIGLKVAKRVHEGNEVFKIS